MPHTSHFIWGTPISILWFYTDLYTHLFTQQVGWGLKALPTHVTQYSQKFTKHSKIKLSPFLLETLGPPRESLDLSLDHSFGITSHAPVISWSGCMRAYRYITEGIGEGWEGRRDRTHSEYFIGARAHAWSEARVQGLLRAPGFITTGILLLLRKYHPSAFNNSPASEC